jgi:hypothetical protein
MMGKNALYGIPARWASGANIQRFPESPSGVMKTLLRIFPLALMLLGAVLLFERPAYAYADPGTGLLAIQAAGSALVAAGWYLRRKIYALFHRGAPKGQDGGESVSTSSEDSPQP